MEFPSCFIQNILWILTAKLRSQLLRFTPQLGRALATALLNKVSDSECNTGMRFEMLWMFYRYVIDISRISYILSIFLGESRFCDELYHDFTCWIQMNPVLESLATQNSHIPTPGFWGGNCAQPSHPRYLQAQARFSHKASVVQKRVGNRSGQRSWKLKTLRFSAWKST